MGRKRKRACRDDENPDTDRIPGFDRNENGKALQGAVRDHDRTACKRFKKQECSIHARPALEGHVYRDTYATGHARVQYGDTIVYGDYYAGGNRTSPFERSSCISRVEQCENNKEAVKAKVWYMAGQALDILAEFCRYLHRVARRINEGKDITFDNMPAALTMLEDLWGCRAYIDVNIIMDWDAFDYLIDQKLTEPNVRTKSQSPIDADFDLCHICFNEQKWVSFASVFRPGHFVSLISDYDGYPWDLEPSDFIKAIDNHSHAFDTFIVTMYFGWRPNFLTNFDSTVVYLVFRQVYTQLVRKDLTGNGRWRFLPVQTITTEKGPRFI